MVDGAARRAPRHDEVALRSMEPDDPRVGTLAAMLEQLIPSDQHGPGAMEAGVLDYVMGRYAGSGRQDARLYADGLAALDEQAARWVGTSFAAASPAAQAAILLSVEADALAQPDALRAGTFFETVLRHAQEGMFGDPAHGGNRGAAGWDLLGYPDARRVWTAAEQALDVVVVPLPLPRRGALPPHADTGDER